MEMRFLKNSLVVAGVFIPEKQERVLQELGVKDSKKFSDSRVQEFANLIKKGYKYSLVVIGPERYNELYQKLRNQRAGEAINQARNDAASGPPITPPALHSLNPKAMWNTAELMWEIMRGESGLTTAQREMIATVTSATLSCRF